MASLKSKASRRPLPNKSDPKDVPPPPEKDYPALPLLTGHDIVNLRSGLIPHLPPLGKAEVMHELGMQRTRYEEMIGLGEKPLMRPRVEILVHTLKRYPDWAISQPDSSIISDVVQLLDSVRPERKHGPHDLCLLMGYEASSGYPWMIGKKISPIALRMLRLIQRGLQQPHPEDQLHFLETLESIVYGVGKSHGVDKKTLTMDGFSGFTKLRRAVHKPAGTKPRAKK